MTTKTKVEPGPFYTKDHWAIIALDLCNHIPTSIGMEECGNGRSLMYHYDVIAWTDYDAYMRNEQREPFMTVRRVEEADRRFKNNLTRFNNS